MASRYVRATFDANIHENHSKLLGVAPLEVEFLDGKIYLSFTASDDADDTIAIGVDPQEFVQAVVAVLLEGDD